MKTIRTILYVGFIFFTFSCINDLGNYNYLSKEEVIPMTIADLQDTTVIAGEIFEIAPQISNMDNESRYSYLWYTINKISSGLPKRDTLSTERNLSTRIQLVSGDYNLYFEIRNDDLDVFVNKNCKFIVEASLISRGWYILKTVNDETDFDFVSLDGSAKINDILRTRAGREEYYNGPLTIGNQQLKGKAIKMEWQSSRYTHYAEKKDGTLELLRSQKVFHIFTNKDMKTFNSNNLLLFKNYEDVFYEAPKADIQNLSSPLIRGNMYIINAGKLHSIYTMSSNAGKFPYPHQRETNQNYQLHSDLYVSFSGAIVFDKLSRSFLQISETGTVLVNMAEPLLAGFPSTNNMDYDLIRMLGRATASNYTSGYCLMKNRTNGKYYLGYLSTRANSDYPFTSFREVPSKSKMPEADVFAAPQYASCVYFGKGNILSYYLDAQDTSLNEKVIMTFPADETIAFIDNPEEKTLLVLTNSPSGWKLYGFPIIGVTADIETKPAFTYQGQGEGRHVLYRYF